MLLWPTWKRSPLPNFLNCLKREKPSHTHCFSHALSPCLHERKDQQDLPAQEGIRVGASMVLHTVLVGTDGIPSVPPGPSCPLHCHLRLYRANTRAWTEDSLGSLSSCTGVVPSSLCPLLRLPCRLSSYPRQGCYSQMTTRPPSSVIWIKNCI